MEVLFIIIFVIAVSRSLTSQVKATPNYIKRK